MRNLGNIPSGDRFRRVKNYERHTNLYGQTPKNYKNVDGHHISRKDSYNTEDEVYNEVQTSSRTTPRKCLRQKSPVQFSNESSRESSRSDEVTSMTNTSILFGKYTCVYGKDYGYSGRDDLESTPTVWDRLSTVPPRKRRPFVTIQRTRRSKDRLNRNRKLRPLFPERRYSNRFSNSYVNLRNYRKSSGSDYGEDYWNRNSATENSVCYGTRYKYNPSVQQWMNFASTDQDTTDSEMPRSNQAVAGSEATVSDLSKYMNMEFFEKPKRFKSPSKSPRGRNNFDDRAKPISSIDNICNRISCSNSYKNLSERIPEALNKYLDTGAKTTKRFSSKRKIIKPKVSPMKFPKLYPGKSYPCDSRCEGLDNSYSAENDIVLKNIEYQQPVESSYDTLASKVEKESNNWVEHSNIGRRPTIRRDLENSSLRGCAEKEKLEQELHTDFDPYTNQRVPKQAFMNTRNECRRKVVPLISCRDKTEEQKCSGNRSKSAKNDDHLPKIYNRENIIYTELDVHPKNYSPNNDLDSKVPSKYEPAHQKSVPKEGLKNNRCNITYTAKKVSSSDQNNCSQDSLRSTKPKNCLPLYHDSDYDVKKNSNSVLGVMESDFKPKQRMKRCIQSNMKNGYVVKNQSNQQNSFGVDGRSAKPKTKRCLKSQHRNVCDTVKKDCYDQENYVWESSHRSSKPKTKRFLPSNHKSSANASKRPSKTYVDPGTHNVQIGVSKFSTKAKQFPHSFHKVTFDSRVSYAGEGNKRQRRKTGGAEVFPNSSPFKEYDGLVSDLYCPNECIK